MIILEGYFYESGTHDNSGASTLSGVSFKIS